MCSGAKGAADQPAMTHCRTGGSADDHSARPSSGHRSTDALTMSPPPHHPECLSAGDASARRVSASSGSEVTMLWNSSRDHGHSSSMLLEPTVMKCVKSGRSLSNAHSGCRSEITSRAAGRGADVRCFSSQCRRRSSGLRKCPSSPGPGRVRSAREHHHLSGSPADRHVVAGPADHRHRPGRVVRHAPMRGRLVVHGVDGLAGPDVGAVRLAVGSRDVRPGPSRSWALAPWTAREAVLADRHRCGGDRADRRCRRLRCWVTASLDRTASTPAAHLQGMSENTARQPKGVPVGGQFAATARGETGLTLGVPATPDPEALAAALTELADAIVRGSDVVLDSYELRDEIIPNVPSQVRDDLWHEVLVSTVHNNDRTVETLTAKLGALEARETRWRNDPTFTSPTGEVTHQGTNGPVVYTTVQGSKYTGTRDVAAVAKDVRTDLKDAVTAGYLPDDVTFAVTCSKYAGGQAMQVDVR